VVRYTNPTFVGFANELLIIKKITDAPSANSERIRLQDFNISNS
jgi:hypothetical protein